MAQAAETPITAVPNQSGVTRCRRQSHQYWDQYRIASFVSILFGRCCNTPP